MRKIFGTDGVRGVANRDVTPELAFAIGRAGAAILAGEIDRAHPIVVGRDPRLSGTMLEAALSAGITSVGRDVISVGVVPTPAVACITRSIEAAAGVMISASHNPVEDNGIKFFGPDGFKLPDTIEAQIEASLESHTLPRPTHDGVGTIKQSPGLADRYFMSLLEAGGDLTGLTIIVDAACGAACVIAPGALRKLGATVDVIHGEPDGNRINVACGATDLRSLSVRVREFAQRGENVAGVAFDGDADRALFVDESGSVVNGDHVMLILARALHRAGQLPGATVVGTVMSNLGLEKALAREGMTLLRAAVGDRYVLEQMRAGGFTFGGEQSGHIIDLTRNTTGDGPLTAIQLFSLLARERVSLRELAADLPVFPQILVNIKTEKKSVLDATDVRAAIEATTAQLGAAGRVLVRASGTEPLVRVMIEGPEQSVIEQMAHELADVIKQASLSA